MISWRPRWGGSSRLALLAALVAVAGLLPGPASAAPERGALVVEGQGGSSVEWVLTGDTTVYLRSPSPELTGGGSHAGLLIEPLEGSPGDSQPVGGMQVRAFADRTQEAVGLLGVDTHLEPGRYRVTLFGEGPVRARYALAHSEAPGIRIVPRASVPVRFHARSELLTAGQDAARVELPRAATANRRVVQMSLLDGTSVGEREMCVTADRQCHRQLLPLCPPMSLPCEESPLPVPGGHAGDPAMVAVLHEAQPVDRTLLWTTSGYRDADDRLRAAAIVF
jgi:hypothetical protein